MTKKQIKVGTDELVAGINAVRNAVVATMGPKGRFVIIDKIYGDPVATKDGMTVAKEFTSDDPVEMTGVKMIQDMTKKVAEESGDGTTCATLLCADFIRIGAREIKQGKSPNLVCQQLDQLVQEVKEHVDRVKINIAGDEKMVKNVARVSLNGDDVLADIVAEAILKTGIDGVVNVEKSSGFATNLEITEGMRVAQGYASPYFVTDPEKMVTEFEDAQVFLSKKRILTMKEIIKILESAYAEEKPLLIVCDQVHDDVLAMLIANRLDKNFKVCVVSNVDMDGTMDDLRDLAIYTGANIVGDDVDSFDKVKLGRADKVRVTRNSLTVTHDTSKDEVLVGSSETAINEKFTRFEESIKARVSYYKNKTNDETLSVEVRDAYKKKLARLTGGVAVIKVGGLTKAEISERKDRVDDAVAATKLAIKSGVVAGGGRCLASLFESGMELSSFDEVLLSPIRQMCKNAGVTLSVIDDCVTDLGGVDEKSDETIDNSIPEPEEPVLMTVGYNFATDKNEDLVDAGIVDPAEVVVNAVRYAASTAKTVLSTACVMTEIEEEEK